MKSLNNYIAESARFSSKDEYILETKKVDSKSLADEFVKMTLNDNDAETIEDDIEIFLDEVEEQLYNKDRDSFERFRSALIKHVDRY
ncbi:MAG: hypothetical protein J1F35_08075 [Erysipelotrichales bacterium]|nr:hypothetical protein [Erysipelotrichales bacterium]